MGTIEVVLVGGGGAEQTGKERQEAGRFSSDHSNTASFPSTLHHVVFRNFQLGLLVLACYLGKRVWVARGPCCDQNRLIKFS